jgi:hypothetical protein
MTAEELQAIRERVNKATPGPWVNGIWYGQCHIDHEHGNGNCVYEPSLLPDVRLLASSVPGVDLYVDDWESRQFARAEDAEFIAWCREGVPKLLDEIEKLRETLLWIQRIASQPLTEIGQQHIVERAAKALNGE